VFAVLTLTLFFWKKRDFRTGYKGTVEETKAIDIEKSARKALFVSSLWPLGAAVVTLVWHEIASRSGGTYFIFWGPMVFGILALVNGFKMYKSSRATGGFDAQAKFLTGDSQSGAGEVVSEVYYRSGKVYKKRSDTRQAQLTISGPAKTVTLSMQGTTIMSIGETDIKVAQINSKQSMAMIRLKSGVLVWIGLDERTLGLKVPTVFTKSTDDKRSKFTPIAVALRAVYGKKVLGY
jgi:hypothetical protein